MSENYSPSTHYTYKHRFKKEDAQDFITLHGCAVTPHESTRLSNMTDGKKLSLCIPPLKTMMDVQGK